MEGWFAAAIRINLTTDFTSLPGRQLKLPDLPSKSTFAIHGGGVTPPPPPQTHTPVAPPLSKTSTASVLNKYNFLVTILYNVDILF